MDTYMHKTMASVASLEKIEIIRSQEFMPSKERLKFLKKMIILGPKTAILGPQFCRILVLGPHFWWSGRPRSLGPPGSAPETTSPNDVNSTYEVIFYLLLCIISRLRWTIVVVPNFVAYRCQFSVCGSHDHELVALHMAHFSKCLQPVSERHNFPWKSLTYI